MTQSQTFRAAVWSVLLSALLLAGLLPPGATPQATAAPPAEKVAVLRLPSGGYWGHPSPFGFNRGPGYLRASLIFDTLVWRDASGETIPWLATDWSLSADGLTWTFTLREGVQWQDGTPFTADDVAFSIQYYLDHPGTAWFMSQADQIASAAPVSEHQVAITLKQPFAPFLQTTAEALLIFPRHIWENVTDPKTYTGEGAFTGTGAYRLVEYSQAEGAYLFEANPDFFLGDPYVQRIEFVPTSDNYLALLNGDIAAFDQFGGVTDEMLAPFADAPYEVRVAPGEWGMFLYFNLEQDTPLRDARVRQAIAHAVDRAALVERVLFGFGEAGSPGFLPPANPFYNPDVPDYTHDPERARALLAEAGYDGTPLKLAYSTDWIMASPRAVEIIESGLSEVGIPLEHIVMDQATMDAATTEGNYEMALIGFGGLGGDPDQLRRSFASSSALRGFARALGYSNPDFDALAEAQLGLADAQARHEAIYAMQTILAEDLPVLPLYYTARVVVFNAAVFDNWTYTPGGWGGGIPMPYNKHQFIVGTPTGLTIRE
ncbi:MAG: diguanylate phosphodiesterase [Anaerolineae bacterium]|nr:diguanylate phosphodiesterase [Anaerolineae bacterium]